MCTVLLLVELKEQLKTGAFLFRVTENATEQESSHSFKSKLTMDPKSRFLFEPDHKIFPISQKLFPKDIKGTSAKHPWT